MTLKIIVNKAITELKKSGSKTAALDVKTILGHVLEKDDVYLLTHDQDIVSNAQYQKFRRLIRRREKGEPIAYLVGHKEFYGLDFTVNKNVLIPRPESEILVSRALEIINEKITNRSKPINIIDIGTGSGCLILSLIKNLINATSISFYASDISTAALNVAKRNANILGCHNLRFFKSDLLKNHKIPKQLDIVIANLPYLTDKVSDLKYSSPAEIGLTYEPSLALYARNHGFALIRQLVEQLPNTLLPKGTALLEIDESHATKLGSFCTKLNLKMSTIDSPSRFRGFAEITHL